MIATHLRESALSHSVLNRAASQIDHLGRKLHGFEFSQDREIAECLTAAIRALNDSHAIPEDKRAATVAEAVLQLDFAVRHLERETAS